MSYYATIMANECTCTLVAALYTRARQGRSTDLAPPCPLLCFASVIVWIENKHFEISDRWPLYLFYFVSETISAALVGDLCVFRATTKKVVNFFEKKSVSGGPGSRMFWSRNDLTSLLRWRRHWLMDTYYIWL